MDLRLLLAIPTEAEREAVDEFVGSAVLPTNGNGSAPKLDVRGRVVYGGHEARDQRPLLLPALQAVQARIGWISDGALNYVCERLTVPPADAYGVATFYGLLSVDPRPPRVLHVCEDVVCQCKGSGDLIESLEQRFGSEHEDFGGFTWLRSPCLGQCDRAPAALMTEAGQPVREQVLAPAEPEQAFALLEGNPVPEPPPARVPQQGEPGLRLLRRIGVADPHSLHDYRARDGFSALRRAFELGKAGVIREVKDSGLMGRGGAAFPTGVKWEAVAQQPAHPHYLICNADESEPGTFKDRALLEGDPFAVIESMTIAAYATDCSHGFIYLRGEYPNDREILSHALSACRHHGYLGTDILGEGFDFDIELRQGAGAYICGEETAIFNSIEGYRGEPRPSRRSRRCAGCSASQPSSTTSRRWPMSPGSCSTAGSSTPAPAPRSRPGRVCSASRATSSAPASMRCRSARSSAPCSSAPAGSPAAASCRRCCWAAPPAGSSDPTSLTWS